MNKILFLAIGLLIGFGVTFSAFVLNGDLEPAQKYTENEKEMALILLGQMEISNTDFSCDIDVISRLHDNTICLSKLDVITPTELGYFLHGNISSSHMWFDSDGELVKIKGTNGLSEVEYNGTVNKIKLDGGEYYLITNAIMQGNH